MEENDLFPSTPLTEAELSRTSRMPVEDIIREELGDVVINEMEDPIDVPEWGIGAKFKLLSMFASFFIVYVVSLVCHLILVFF